MVDLILHGVTGTRQDKTEGRSTPLTALHPDPSAMGFDDVFHNRQPKPGSAVAGLARHAEELVEHSRDELPGNSAAIIADRELHAAVLRFLDRYLHVSIGLGVLQCVAQ